MMRVLGNTAEAEPQRAVATRQQEARSGGVQRQRRRAHTLSRRAKASNFDAFYVRTWLLVLLPSSLIGSQHLRLYKMRARLAPSAQEGLRKRGFLHATSASALTLVPGSSVSNCLLIENASDSEVRSTSYRCTLPVPDDEWCC